MVALEGGAMGWWGGAILSRNVKRERRTFLGFRERRNGIEALIAES